MKTFVTLAFAAVAFVAPVLPALAQDTPASVVIGDPAPFEMRVVAKQLDGPWEITLGPDGLLWVTERTAGRITRIDPATGEEHRAVTIKEVSAPGGQDGLLGLALHPELGTGTGNDYVFAAYTYVDKQKTDPDIVDEANPYRHLFAKLVRFTYDAAAETLGDPVELISGMPASSDHNSGRMKIGPDGKLYYTIGDGGNDQLGNWCIAIEAQRLPTADEVAAKDWAAYQGKSLRLNLDGSIPDDNPEINGVRSHVFTYGHRNMQGIDFAPDGTLYASEQGPKTDDEVNILVPGGNYGWPHVAGFRDDKAYQYARWKDASPVPCERIQFSDIEINPNVPVADETSWTEPMQDPLATMFTVPSDWDFTDPICNGVDFICWPTVAASSIEVYRPAPGTGIPGWENSLIVTTLKRGSLYRVPLSEDGKSLRGPIERYFQSQNRFRDTAISPDGKTIYVATDPGGVAEALKGGVTFSMTNPGSILAFTWTGGGDAAAAPEAGGPVPGTADKAASATGEPVFSAAQVARGEAAYRANCVTCHGQNLVNATYGPPLAGPFFAGRWQGRTVAELYGYARDRMPPSRPHSLPDATYADIVAYVLDVNGVRHADGELPADDPALAEMRIALD